MIDKKKYEKLFFILFSIIILSIPLYALKKYFFDIQQQSKGAMYVGRDKCISCHKEEYKQWQNSDHDKAMQAANDSTVLGNFDNAVLVSGGKNHRFFKKDGKFMVNTEGEDGSMQDFVIKYTFGYFPLQQYLVEFDKGRLQTLPLTWNSEINAWYSMVDSTYKNQNIDHNNWLHWTNQAQNWNSMCADCHSTNLKKGYDIATDSYNTTWSEIDVSCETCHGPSSKHLEWADLPIYAQKEIDNYGLIAKTSDIDNHQFVDNCARCHSRRYAIEDNIHGTHIYNHIIPELPTEPSYHIDGQIRDEDYVYGSFIQSKMYMNDVQCNDCHNVHSTKLLFNGNDLCLQCHKAEDYDTKKHHFHKSAGEEGEAVISESGIKFEVGEGTKCKNCHMPGKYYMGADYRHDHSLRIPRPDLSEQQNTPNACNNCHNDKSNQWASSYLEQWHGKSKRFQYGEAFAMAQKANNKGLVLLQKIIDNELYPELIRSTSLHYLGTLYQGQADEKLYAALQNINPMIRLTGLRNLELSTQKAINTVLPMLNDENKAVRIEVANKLSGIPIEEIPQNYRELKEKVTDEYIKSLEYNGDFPVGKFNLANIYYNRKDYQKAEKFYLAALEQDKELDVINMNIAYLYSAMKQPQKAEKHLKLYLAKFPKDASALYSYGLLLSELKQYKKSLEYLIKAGEQQSNNARIDYNIAMLYDFFGDIEKAEKHLQLAIEKENENIGYYNALVDLYVKHKEITKAKKIAQKIIDKFPNSQNIESYKSFINN